MPQISRRVSIAAGATNTNVLQGSTFEFLRGTGPSIIRMGAVGSAVGMTMAFGVGDRKTVEDGTRVPVEAAAGRGVIRDEDVKYEEGGFPGDRMVLSATNPTAGALDFDFHVEII